MGYEEKGVIYGGFGFIFHAVTILTASLDDVTITILRR